MAAPLTTSRNDYTNNRKRSDIYTPIEIADFLFNISEKWYPEEVIFDPAVGSGNLTHPWMNLDIPTYGMDIVKDPSVDLNCDYFKEMDFLSATRDFMDEWMEGEITNYPSLVICNPPFNNSGGSGRKLMPEVFLDHIFDLWGIYQDVILFTPMGFRLNQRKHSKRWRKYRNLGVKITSIISLPLDIFEGVEFHSEILVFNREMNQAHYWLDSDTLL